MLKCTTIVTEANKPLGILGVNLIYSCYHKNEDIDEFLTKQYIVFQEIELKLILSIKVQILKMSTTG